MHFLYAPLLVAWLALYAALDRRAGLDALALLLIALLAMPRLLGLVEALSDRTQYSVFGGRAWLVANVILDQLLASLLYPTLIISHLVGLAGLMVGGETRWDAQARSYRGLRWNEATRRLSPTLAVALAASAVLAPFAPLSVAFLASGLAAGIPLAVIKSRLATSRRVFAIPDDTNHHALRRRGSTSKRASGPGRNSIPMPNRNLFRRIEGWRCLQKRFEEV